MMEHTSTSTSFAAVNTAKLIRPWSNTCCVRDTLQHNLQEHPYHQYGLHTYSIAWLAFLANCHVDCID